MSKRPESVWSSPAAVTVVTSQDIERVGATSIPEALRWVPGLNVAQIDSNNWAIGARGFQWQNANKLLVMIDGRPVYNPASGGVRWQDSTTFVDDIDRIEVVRGPGSSVWGANAVNGVIDIVTRSAFDTIGSHVFAAAGDELVAGAGVRHGMKLSDNAALRVYGQYRKTDGNVLVSGNPSEDGARLGQGGFRFDGKTAVGDLITVQGDAYAQTTDYVRDLATLTAPPSYVVHSTSPIKSRGANLLGRWRHESSETTYFEAQAFWDHVFRDRPQEKETLNASDVSLVWGTRLGERHEITVGFGYRFIDGRRVPKLVNYQPSALRTKLAGIFIQDQFVIVPDRWTATIGSRLEHNNFTGWEPQPTARLAFTPSASLVLWSSIAQAVRTPTWDEVSVAADVGVFGPGVFDPVLPATIRVFGNPNLKSEKLTAFEVGARWKLTNQLSVDVAAFSYSYSDYILATFTDVTIQSTPPALVRNSTTRNGLAGEAYGGEVAVRWSPAEWWQFFASYSYVNIQLHTKLTDPFGFEQDETTTPDNAIQVQSSLRFGRQWEWNLGARYVDPVRYYSVPAYTELDSRLTWKPREHLQISLVGHNLLHAQHLEYDSAVYRQLTPIQRSVLVIVRTDF